MYRVAAYSNVGSVKDSNQDSCCVEVAQTPYGDTALMAVCDGVGGLSSGEVASASVVRWLTSWFEQRFSRLIEEHPQDTSALFDCVEREWTNGIVMLNDTLRLYGRSTNQRMGSTFTAMLLVGSSYVIGHVGDCRVYQVYNRELTQLTEDQTWVAREVARGTITPEQARSHPRHNVILQSVGTQEEIHPVFYRGAEGPIGTTYFLCCDGFRNELFDDEMVDAFDSAKLHSEQDMYDAAVGLAKLAMTRGERDNVSAVVMVVCEGDEYGEPLIRFEDGIATIVDTEEEALPTGWLDEEQDPSNEDVPVSDNGGVGE